MVQTFDFVLYANRNPSAKRSILEAIASQKETELIVDRQKLTFIPNSQYVIVDKVSADVPFADKIVKCKLPYMALLQMLNGNWDNLEGLEWL